MTYKFTLMPQSWYKRREPNLDDSMKIETFEVTNFELVDNSSCDLTVVLRNGTCLNLIGKVALNCSYQLDGIIDNERWTVHGIDHRGFSILLRVGTG